MNVALSAEVENVSTGGARYPVAMKSLLNVGLFRQPRRLAQSSAMLMFGSASAIRRFALSEKQRIF